MSGQHTPGPWAVLDGTLLRTSEFASFPRTIGKGLDTDGSGPWIHVAHISQNPVVGAEEAEANAHLIAAAPEMLVALERLAERVAELESDLNDGLNEAVRAYYGHVTPALAFAQRIAAKARGEA